MERTDTTASTSFTRHGQVTYQFDPATTIVTIMVPVGSKWTSGLHWHESHTEYLQVVKGSATVTIGDETRILSGGSGAIRIEAYAKHEWKRADEALGQEGEDSDGELQVEEWTTPMDGQKEIFFRNLNSVLSEENASPFRHFWIMLQLFVIFYGLDNYPAFVGGFPDYCITHVILGLSWLLGLALDVKPVYDEYTPKRLLDRQKKGKRAD